MKHTPGPWKICDDGCNVYAPGFDVAITNSNDICYPDYPEAEANARLIAAAPDLLEAAQAAIAALSQNAVFPADIAAAKKWLGDAIARATGD